MKIRKLLVVILHIITVNCFTTIPVNKATTRKAMSITFITCYILINN